MSKSSYAKIFGSGKIKSSKYDIKVKKGKSNKNIFGDPIKKKKKKKKNHKNKDIDKLIAKAIDDHNDLIEVFHATNDPESFISVTNLKSSNIEPGTYIIGIPGGIKLAVFIVREEDNVVIYLISGSLKLEECLDGVSEDEPIINYVAKIDSDILSTIIINQSED